MSLKGFALHGQKFVPLSYICILFFIRFIQRKPIPRLKGFYFRKASQLDGLVAFLNHLAQHFISSLYNTIIRFFYNIWIKRKNLNNKTTKFIIVNTHCKLSLLLHQYPTKVEKGFSYIVTVLYNLYFSEAYQRITTDTHISIKIHFEFKGNKAFLSW